LMLATEAEDIEKERYGDDKEYKTMIENMPIGIFILDENKEFIFTNPTFRKTFKIKDEKIIGKKFTAYLTENSKKRFEKFLDKIKKDKEMKKFELIALNEEDEDFPVEISTNMMNKEGHFNGFVCTVRNLSDIKKTQDELKKRVIALERYKQATVNRELRVIELKQEINKLCKKYGEEPKYFEMNEELKEKCDIED
ncbi:MAG: PAS domain S-box protein, partial [Candidatus Thermoplasmatota archaeon]